MKALVFFIFIFLPGLTAMFIDSSKTPALFFGNIFIMFISYVLLNKYQLFKTHFYPLFIFLTFISILAVFSYHDSVTIGSQSFPYIPGGDGEGYYEQAKYLAKGNPFDISNILLVNYMGYQIILGLWFKLMGTDLFNGILLNYGILTISLVLLSISTYLLTENKKTSYYTLILSFACSHFIGSGIILLKDVFILFSFSLILFTLVKYYKGSKSPFLLVNLIFSGFILGALRLPFLFILPIVSLLIGRFYSLKNMVLVGVMVAGFIIALPFFLTLTHYTFSGEEVTEVVMETSFVQDELEKAEFKGGAVQRLIGDYNSMPIAKRIAMLPVPVLIQFVTPFKFWSTDFISDHIYYIFDQLNFFWFGLIGVFLFIVLFKLKWIRDSNIKKLFVFGFSMYILMAFIYGGAVPRYAMPFIMFMMPAMGYMINLIKVEPKSKSYAIRFFITYYGLAFCLFCLYLAIKLF